MDWIDLVATAAEGDVSSFEALVKQFQGMAVAYAYSVLRDFDLAEDAAQEAFLIAYRDLSKLAVPKAFPSWFRRIIFKCCDRLTRRQGISTVPIELALDVTSREPDPSRAAQEKELRNHVIEAIHLLTENERAATTLFYMDDYSLVEIGEFLGISVKAVKNRLFMARTSLRERMVDLVEETLKENAPHDDFSARVISKIFILEMGNALDISLKPDFKNETNHLLASLRKRITENTGFSLLRFSAHVVAQLNAYDYNFAIMGKKVGEGTIYPECLMVRAIGIPYPETGAIPCIDQVTGFPAFWINKDQVAPYRLQGYPVASASEVLIEHLSMFLQKDGARLLLPIMAPGGDPDAKNEDGLTPLSIAAGCENEEAIQFLLSKGASVLTMHSTVYLGKLDEVRKLLRNGESAEPKVHHPRVMTPLILAALRGYEEIAKLLIKHGAGVNAYSLNNGNIETPLRAAIRNGHNSIAGLLISNGADVNAKDSWGRISLHHAAEINCNEIIDALLKNGANPNIKDVWSRTPSETAIYSGHLSLGQRLRQIEKVSTSRFQKKPKSR